MSADLSQFATTITKLRHEHGASDLAEKITLYEPRAKQSDKFLIKMEIRRLAQPISRVIDLRDQIKQGCERVERGGISHYLDELALADFDQEYKQYKNTYCLGVFEYVTKRAKNRDEKTLVEAKLPDPRFISLTRVHQRRDIRIYYSSEVQLFFTENPDFPHGEMPAQDATGITTDLSERGLSIKLDDCTVQVAHILLLKFIGLEQEFLVKDPLFVRYKLLRQIARDGATYAILTIDEEQSDTVLEACRGLLRACIHNQKRRNRVPVDNTVESIEAKVREQFVMGKLADLPVLLAKKDNALIPVSCLKSSDNESLDNFLRMPKGSLLTALFNQPIVLESCKDLHRGHQTFFLLRFRDKSKALCVAAIPVAHGYANHGIRQLLVKAFEQGGVRLVNIYIDNVDAVSGAYVPTSLPDSAGEIFENLNRPLHPKLKKIIGKGDKLAMISDISDSAKGLRIQESLSNVEGDSSSALSLRRYFLDLNLARDSLFWCQVENSETRQESRLEDRFKLKLAMRIVGRRKENKNVAFNAFSTNVSTRGLHIVVDGEHPFAEGNDLFVDMKLKLGESEQLITGQRYRVVKAQGPELWLAVTGDLASHKARISLRKLINDNLDKLTAIGSNDAVYGLSRAMRNLVATNHPNLFGALTRIKNELLVQSLMRSESHHPIKFQSSMAEPIGLKILVKNQVFREALETHLKRLSQDVAQVTFHICMVLRKKRQSTDVSLIVKTLEATGETTSSVYQNLKSFGEPRLLRIKLQQNGPVFDKYFRDEMRYLLRYAKLKQQECIEFQNAVLGIFEIQDITDIYKTAKENG